jgi:DNA-binding NtrC family response regulator
MGGGGDKDERAGQLIQATAALFEQVHARIAESHGKRGLTLDEWVDLATASRIAQALRDARGNRSAAARVLGIGRRTLYTKMQKLGVHAAWKIPRPEQDES